MLNVAAVGDQNEIQHKTRIQRGKALAEEHQRHTKHVEQSRGSKDDCEIEGMIDPIDDEGEDTSQDGQRDTNGCDTCSEDDDGTDIPGRRISTR